MRRTSQRKMLEEERHRRIHKFEDIALNPAVVEEVHFLDTLKSSHT